MTRFVAGDLAALALQPAQAGELRWFETRRAGEEYEKAGNAFTIRDLLRQAQDERGAVIFCGGAVERHPHYATLWGLFGEHFDAAAVRFMLSRTRTFIDNLPHRRVDALVEERPAAIRYARKLGLVAEARLWRASFEGKDMLVFRRPDEGDAAHAAAIREGSE